MATFLRRVTAGVLLAGALCLCLPCVRAQAGAAKGGDKPAAPDMDEKRRAEQAARERITEFNKSLKGLKTSSEIAGVVRGLGDTKHILIVNKLIGYLACGDDAIEAAAAEALEEIGDPGSAAALSGTLQGNLPKVNDHAALCTALCKAIGKIGDPRGTPGLISALNCKNVGVITAACAASGNVKDPVLIEELIKLYKEASVPDATIYRQGQGGGPGGMGAQTVTNPRKQAKEPAHKALCEITGQNFGAPREWQDWWQANRNTWRPKR